jgi:hypothetical protein
VNELVVEIGPVSTEQQDLVVQRAGLQVLAVGVGRMVVLWPSQDARKTRPMKCP